MPSLSELLANPSIESWKLICAVGKTNARVGGLVWQEFAEKVQRHLKHWPPEIERTCPKSWPRGFREAVEHRVRETDTYSHYIAKICGHPDLKLSDGSQAVWLERRFTGGAVHVSTVQQALRALDRGDTQLVRNILAGGVRQVGKIGCADLTGGLTIVRPCCDCVPCMGGFFHHCESRRHIEVRLEVEIKVGDEEQREEQVARMNSVRQRGGCYVLARSVEEAVEQIKAFMESR